MICLTQSIFKCLIMVVNKCLYLIITLIALPLLGCNCVHDTEVLDFCSSCNEQGPVESCDHPCMDDFEYLSQDSSNQDTKISLTGKDVISLNFQPIQKFGFENFRKGFPHKQRIHIQLRVIQV
jgi:hypothetical protein